MIQHQSYKEDFFRNINSVDPSIQFTMEESKENGSIPLLDANITPQPDGTFTIGVYRKPTHTDSYLPWDSYHNFSAKYSVINTLSHIAQTICSTPQLLNKLQHLEKVLMLCKYPKWAIKIILNQQEEKKEGKKKKQTPPSKCPARKCYIMVHSVQGICEILKNICGRHGVTTF